MSDPHTRKAYARAFLFAAALSLVSLSMVMPGPNVTPDYDLRQAVQLVGQPN